MDLQEVQLRATVLLAGRPVLAVACALSLRELELELGDVPVLARRATVILELGDEEGALRISAEVERARPGSLFLRILGFAPGGRTRLERFLDERDTLTLAVVDEDPLLLVPPVARKRLPQGVAEYTRQLPQVLTSIPPGARRVATPVVAAARRSGRG